MQQKIYTTYQISQLLNIDITTVMSWVNKGWLTAYKTPGGHRRIEPQHLIAFLEKYKMPIPPQIKVSNAQILIVDDDVHFLRLATRALSKLEPKPAIETAGDGFQAGAKLESFLPDVVIVDLMMPNIDGFSVCQNIRKQKRFNKVKILAISGYLTEENKEKVLACGADKYMQKTGDLEELRQTVSKLLGEI